MVGLLISQGLAGWINKHVITRVITRPCGLTTSAVVFCCRGEGERRGGWLPVSKKTELLSAGCQANANLTISTISAPTYFVLCSLQESCPIVLVSSCCSEF